MPLLPAFTNHKSQGRSLTEVIVDVAGFCSLQSLYVMLSRVKTLDGLAILRPFLSKTITQPLHHEFKDEFKRLAELAEKTRLRFEASRYTAHRT